MNVPVLAAQFSADAPARLLPLYVERQESYGNARPSLSLLGECAVTGRAQDVMFFIGFVAEQGEGSLLSVRTL